MNWWEEYRKQQYPVSKEVVVKDNIAFFSLGWVVYEEIINDYAIAKICIDADAEFGLPPIYAIVQ